MDALGDDDDDEDEELDEEEEELVPEVDPELLEDCEVDETVPDVDAAELALLAVELPDVDEDDEDD